MSTEDYYKLSQKYDELQTAKQIGTTIREISSIFWNAAILILLTVCAYFLWRILEQIRKESAMRRQFYDAKPKNHLAPNKTPFDGKHTEAKPPLLDLHNQNQNTHIFGTYPNANAEDFLKKDLPYMPKINLPPPQA